MKKTLVAGAAVLLALSLTGCASGPTVLQKVYEDCSLSDGAKIGDDGKTLSVDMMGQEEYTGATFDDISCIVNSTDLKMPEFVISGIETTRALDGRQTGEWEGFEAQWSYHPDNGLDLLIHQK